MKFKNPFNIVIFFLCLILPSSVFSYDITWRTTDTGGGTIDGSRYTLSGTIGQPDTDDLQGGKYSISGGYWQGDNDKPEDVNTDKTSADENLPTGSIIADFTTADPDTGDIHTYTLVSGQGDTDNAAFFTDGATLKNAEIFSFNDQNTYTIRIRATDGDGNFTEKMFVIKINDNGTIAFNETENQLELVSDNDGNEFFSPGDTLQYTAVIPNTGDKDAENVVFTAPVPSDTTFVPGSLNISVSENLHNTDISDIPAPVYNETLNRIEWIGDIPDGVKLTIAFDIIADKGIKAGESVTSQGLLAFDTDGDGKSDSSELTNGAGEDQPAKITVPVVPIATGIASSVSYTVADLRGTVNPKGKFLAYYFEYGETEDYGSTTPETDAGQGYDNLSVTAYSKCLSEQTVYHYRLVTVDENGNRHYGQDRTFTTSWTLPGGDYKWMHKDDEAFTGWATGWADLHFGKHLVYGSKWKNPEYALGKADSDCHESFMAMGTGGSITLTFDKPVTDGTGEDFAVFAENDTDTWLELAFVEVSSDGENFVRFDSESLNPPGFGSVDPSLVKGFAGRYRAGYGSRFDLADLKEKEAVKSGLVNLKRITHIKLTDIVSGYDTDSDGNIIYDAYYYTPSHRSGFDLDAVGVIHEACDYGDVNGDGELNLKDAVVVLNILSGVYTGNICISADVNGDMNIGIEELLYILRNTGEL